MGWPPKAPAALPACSLGDAPTGVAGKRQGSHRGEDRAGRRQRRTPGGAHALPLPRLRAGSGGGGGGGVFRRVTQCLWNGRTGRALFLTGRWCLPLRLLIATPVPVPRP